MAKSLALDSKAMGRRWDLLVEESAKCELLCANCHAQEEARRALAAYAELPERRTDTARQCVRHGWQPHHHDGVRWRCSTCRSEHVIAWYRRRKAELVDRLGGCCEACGLDRPLAALQFHHREPTLKRFALSGPGLHRPIDDVLAEAAGCALLCANCHVEVEAPRRLNSRGADG